jgi:predicted nucleic acid-binding protein
LKKVRREELSKEQALLAAGLLQGAEIELLPTRPLLEAATTIASDLDHPAYDCAYLALAAVNDCQFVTADERFRRRVADARPHDFRDRVVSLRESATIVRNQPKH